MSRFDPAEPTIQRARLFLEMSSLVETLSPRRRRQLEELLTGDSDGRGLGGEGGRLILMIARNFRRWSYPMAGVDPRGDRPAIGAPALE